MPCRPFVLACSLAALTLAGAPPTAEAQFTAAVTMPRRVRRAPQTLADSTTRPDTIRPTILSDLKAWVDSATVAKRAPAAPREPRGTPPDSVRARRPAPDSTRRPPLAAP